MMLRRKTITGCISCFICLVLVLFGASGLKVSAEEPVSGSDADAENLLKELLREKGLKDQEKSVLTENHIKAAMSYYKEGDLTKAREEYKLALSLDPDNKQAQAGLAKVQAGWNKEMEGLYNQGLKSYKKKDFFNAEEAWSKISPESSYYEKVKGSLEEIRASKEVSGEAKIQETPSKAGKPKAGKLKKEADAMGKGIQAYKSEEYQYAIDNFNAYLTQNPASQEAKDWLALAERKMERETERKAVQDRMQKIAEEKEIDALKRELQEKEMMRKVDEKYFPPKKEVGLTAIDAGRGQQISDDERKRRELELKIKSTMVPALDFKEIPIIDVIEQLADMTGVNLFLDPAALQEGTGSYATTTEVSATSEPTAPPLAPDGRRPEFGAPGIPAPPAVTTTTTTTTRTAGLKVSFRTVAPLSLWTLLDKMLKIVGLEFKVEPELILISTPERLRVEALETRTYRLKYGVRKTRQVELKEFEERTD